MGSFTSALIYRVPTKKGWGAVRSACPSCKTKLSALDLVPLFSWIFSGGKCRYCKTKVSFIYPALELLCAGLSCGVYSIFGFTVEALFIIGSLPFLMALFVIDFKHYILPNQLVFIVLVIGLIRLFYFSVSDVFVSPSDLFMPYIGGAFIYALVPYILGVILTAVLKKDALGMGDVKFFFAAGVWLGVSDLANFMMLSGALAIVFALSWRVIKKKDVFPFGPALIVSFYSLLLLRGVILV